MASVSVVVPIHNGGSFIEAALSSLERQTVTNLSIIVVDDGSTDDTSEKAQAFCDRDNRFSLIRLEENLGVTNARSVGVSRAISDFVGFVDGDDQVEPTMYAKLLESAEATGSDIVLCNAWSVLPDGSLQPRTELPDRVLHGSEVFRAFSRLELGTGALWNKLYRTEILKTVPFGDFASLKMSEDYLTNIFCFSKARTVAVIRDYLYFAVEREGSVSRSQVPHKNLLNLLEAFLVAINLSETSLPGKRDLVWELYRRQLRFAAYSWEGPQGDLAASMPVLRERLQELVQIDPVFFLRALQGTVRESGPEGGSSRTDRPGFVGRVRKLTKRLRASIGRRRP